MDPIEIKTNFPTADFWLRRKGSIDKVGEPVRVFSREHFGVKVDARIDPNYFYYLLQYLWGTGMWKPCANGTLNLKHLRKKDVEEVFACVDWEQISK